MIGALVLQILQQLRLAEGIRSLYTQWSQTGGAKPDRPNRLPEQATLQGGTGVPMGRPLVLEVV
jgi:hypothetical protein